MLSDFHGVGASRIAMCKAERFSRVHWRAGNLRFSISQPSLATAAMIPCKPGPASCAWARRTSTGCTLGGVRSLGLYSVLAKVRTSLMILRRSTVMSSAARKGTWSLQDETVVSVRRTARRHHFARTYILLSVHSHRICGQCTCIQHFTYMKSATYLDRSTM